jgi:hypothetical protein
VAKLIKRFEAPIQAETDNGLFSRELKQAVNANLAVSPLNLAETGTFFGAQRSRIGIRQRF